jgi:questin oxidase-like protein
MNVASYAVMDDALAVLSPYGPDLKNGLTSHAPMAAEALCALGRPEAVLPWIAAYRAGMLPRPLARERIDRAQWRSALGREDRVADWSALFADELQTEPWRAVLDRWVARLAPGISASATHGVIRVGHAVRSLADADSPRRLAELADALALWAATYQELPTDPHAPDRGLRPRDAILQVAVMPPERRRFLGTITSSLDALGDTPDFAAVIGLVDVSGDARALVAELTDLFARVYLANAHDVLTAIVFIHGVTSIAALENILPHVPETTARPALRFAWQTSCGLYAAFGHRPTPPDAIEPPREDADTLVDLALAHGDEHAIKFTEACLRYHTLNPSPAYLAAARHAIEMLPPS